MSGTTGSLRTAFGWALTVFAALWLLLTGGCTLVSLVMGVVPAVGGKWDGEALSLLLLVLIVGGIGIAPGVALFWAGSKLRRGPRPGPG